MTSNIPTPTATTDAPIQAKTPTFAITLYSVDGCECLNRYAIGADGEVCQIEDGEWSPEEPNEHTDNAELRIEWADGRPETAVELTGNQWRDLEDYGALDELLVAIAGGQEPVSALQAVLAEVGV